MKKIFNSWLGGTLFLVVLLVGCDVLKGLPTNTTGGVFSLNGNWRLETSSDNSLTGSVIAVYPVSGEGTLTSIQNNTYCVRANDAMWKSIVSSNGGFSVSNLSNSCGGSLVYRPATITVITNEEVRLSGTTSAGASLIQTWKRIIK